MKKRTLLMFAALTAIFFLFGTAAGQIPLPVIPGFNATEVPTQTPEPANEADADELFRQGKAFYEKKDNANARYYISQAADQGHAEAQYYMGEFYYFGNDVTQNYKEAVKWYRKAANQGNAEAEYSLGYCYQYGEGVKQDYEEAVKWYQKAADQGHASAQNNLGYCYDYGEGVTQDHEEAVKWYQKAADQGHASAQNNLGYCYQYGEGVKQDYEEAVKWYQKAADQGLSQAQHNLGYLYYFGEGVAQDYEEAVKWFRLAADQGHAVAQNNLGYCYEYGKGVTQDYEEAEKWYQKAAEQGYEKAAQALEKIQSRATVKHTSASSQSQKTMSVGDVITFGNYEQDNILNNGTEPIEWRVLAVEDGKALVVSEYALDTKPFNNTQTAVTWERSTLRNWLNTDFYENAFTAEEKERIELTIVKNPDNPVSGVKGGNDTKDRVFLLSYDEVNEYFSSDEDRQCRLTLYAEANGGSSVTFDEMHISAGWWYLRTPGAMDMIISCVFPHGEARYEGLTVWEDYTVIRPALWLNLNDANSASSENSKSALN